jgi:hypothetical protein
MRFIKLLPSFFILLSVTNLYSKSDYQSFYSNLNTRFNSQISGIPSLGVVLFVMLVGVICSILIIKNLTIKKQKDFDNNISTRKIADKIDLTNDPTENTERKKIDLDESIEDFLQNNPKN